MTEDIKLEHERLANKRIKVKVVSPNIGKMMWYQCPPSWISQDTANIIDMLTIEKTPPKIYPGPWPKQPVWWMESIKIYNSQLAIFRERQREQAKHG